MRAASVIPVLFQDSKYAVPYVNTSSNITQRVVYTTYKGKIAAVGGVKTANPIAIIEVAAPQRHMILTRRLETLRVEATITTMTRLDSLIRCLSTDRGFYAKHTAHVPEVG